MGAVFLLHLGASLNLWYFSVCMFTLVAFTLLLETLVEHIEHMILRWENEHYMQIFNKVLSELMILGTISFLIFGAEQLFGLQEKEFYYELEFAHLLLFMVAFAFLAQASFLLKVMTVYTKFWDKISSSGINQAIETCKAVVANRTRNKQPGLYKRRLLKERFNFFIIKHHFLTKHQLPM